MVTKVIFLLICVTIAMSSYSQYRIEGTLINSKTATPVQGATVLLSSNSDSAFTRTTLTDTAGRFMIRNLQRDSFRLVITYVGLPTVRSNIQIDTSSVDLGKIELSPTSNVLEEVTVTASAPMATQKGDTVQFNANQFKVNPDATAEDLARKMPGITVENGQVKAQGENVQKVTIDGRDLFGDDATAALRNLPAEIIDKIQVFDRLSDQAQFTGFDDGSSQKGINIITKANMRNGQFGRVFAGYGTDNRYSAGGNTTILKDNRKISLVGNFNNINQQNFASQDLLGVTSTASQRGGGRQGGGGGPRGGGGRSGNSGGNQGGGSFGNTSNFLVGQQNGINKTNAVGINYADNWGKKLIVSGSYFFNNTNNNTEEAVNRQYLLAGIPNFDQVTTSSNINYNHRVNMRVEYKIDSANQLIFTPSISFQKNNSNRDVATSFFNPDISTTNKTSNISNSLRNGYNMNNNILYRHTFAKRGRTLSVNLNTSANRKTGDVYTDLFDTTFTGTAYTDSVSRRLTNQLTNGYQLAGNMAYTEPVGKNSQLLFNYNPSYSKSKADQEAYQHEQSTGKYSVFDPTLSNKFDNTFTAQNAGISYRYGTKDNQLSFGANYQYSLLHSDQEFPRSLVVEKTFSNILPNAMARLKLSTRSNIRIMYRASTIQPSVTQLQNVYDITNIPFVTAGNPELEQQYMHIISTRYTYTNTQKNLLFVGNVFVQTANNYITNATYVPLRDSALTTDITLKSGQQLSKPVNLNGYLNIRSFANFAFPVKVIKSNLNLNGGISYSKLPGIINNVSNISENTTYTAGAVIGSNISQYVDFTISYAANFNKVKNEIQPDLNSNYFSHVADLQMNLLSKKGWFFQNDINNQLYSGLTAGFNQSYFLWNMSIGKKFLANQKGELKLSVFDLLKQNQSISRNVTETYIEDIQNVVLRQYFMLTFTYNLRTFGTGPSRNTSGINTNRQNRGF